MIGTRTRRWIVSHWKLAGIGLVATIAAGCFVVWTVFAAANYYLSHHRDLILKKIAKETGLQIEVGQIEADWRLHRPQLRLAQVVIHSGEMTARADYVLVTLRVRESLVSWDLRLRGAEIVKFRGEFTLDSSPQLVEAPATPKGDVKSLVHDLRDLRRKLEQVTLVDAEVILKTKAFGTSVIYLEYFDVSGDLDEGDLNTRFRLNHSGVASLQGSLGLSESGDISVSLRTDVTNFPAPLVHIARKDFEQIAPEKLTMLCKNKDYGAIPCLEVDRATANVKVTVGDDQFLLTIADLKVESKQIIGRGFVDIAQVGQDVSFDVKVEEAKGSLEAVLGVLPSEWLGIETYSWLLKHLHTATADQGVVKIRGATNRAGFDEFVVNLKTQVTKLDYSPDWPAIEHIQGEVTIAADSLNVTIDKGQFAGIPLNKSSFIMESFSREPVIGKVTASMTPKFSALWQALQKTPIKTTLQDLSKYLTFADGNESATLVQLGINFSKFEQEGISYLVKSTPKALTIHLKEPWIRLNETNLVLEVDGKASEQSAVTVVRASMQGKSAGLWDLGNQVFGRLEVDTTKPWNGFRLAVRNQAAVVLPEQIGFDVKTDQASGTLFVMGKPKQERLVARINHIIVPEDVFKTVESQERANAPDVKAEIAAPQSSLLSLDPQKMPAIDFEIGTLKLGELEPGRIVIKARKDFAGLRGFKGSMTGHRMSGDIIDGEWIRMTNGRNSSSFRGNLKLADTGLALKRLGVFSGMVGGNSTAAFGLRWDGSPLDFNMNTVSGNFGYNLLGGELVSVDSVFVKVMDVLTLKNFKFYKSGSKVEKSDGTFAMKAANIKMEKVHLELESAKIQFKGDIQLDKKEISTDVGIELKLGSTIGTAAAGAVLGPAGAIIGYLAADNFKLPGVETLNKLTAFSYRLEGPWEEPKVSAFKPSFF